MNPNRILKLKKFLHQHAVPLNQFKCTINQIMAIFHSLRIMHCTVSSIFLCQHKSKMFKWDHAATMLPHSVLHQVKYACHLNSRPKHQIHQSDPEALHSLCLEISGILEYWTKVFRAQLKYSSNMTDLKTLTW